MRTAVAIGLTTRVVLFDDNSTSQITNMLDRDGEETDNINEAASVIAPDNEGKWHCLFMSDFETVLRC